MPRVLGEDVMKGDWFNDDTSYTSFVLNVLYILFGFFYCTYCLFKCYKCVRQREKVLEVEEAGQMF